MDLGIIVAECEGWKLVLEIWSLVVDSWVWVVVDVARALLGATSWVGSTSYGTLLCAGKCSLVSISIFYSFISLKLVKIHQTLIAKQKGKSQELFHIHAYMYAVQHCSIKLFIITRGKSKGVEVYSRCLSGFCIAGSMAGLSSSRRLESGSYNGSAATVALIRRPKYSISTPCPSDTLLGNQA